MLIVFTKKTISTLSSSGSGTHQPTGNWLGVTQASRRNLRQRSSSHLYLLSSVTAMVSTLMDATQQVKGKHNIIYASSKQNYYFTL
jgi:hypothetical protein